MQLLGSSLEDLFTQRNRKFSLHTVCLLALAMISRVQMMHENSFIHRDLKPENFMVGLEGSSAESTIFIIDMGLAKRWNDRKTG